MASLWLLPIKADHVFAKSLDTLINETVPSDFSSSINAPKFRPHVTLISGIDVQGSAEEWIKKIELPNDFKKEHKEATLELEVIEAGNEYFRKLAIRVKDDDNLTVLRQKIQDQVGGETGKFAPHLSLMYADIPEADVKKKIPLIESQLGWEFGSLFDCCGGTLCMGAKLALVDTSKPIDQWDVIADRDLPWVKWTMARSLI